MGKIGKTFASLLTLMVAMSCLTLLIGQPANAQSIPKPSVPEFTLNYVDNSYDTPTTTTTTIDPYTGEKTVATHPGYHVENKSLEVQIKNQAFTPYTLDNHLIGLYFNISYKGHYEDMWKFNSMYDWDWFFSQSSSDYTTIAFEPLLPAKGEVDFRVQAQIGYFSNGTAVWPIERVYVFTGESSGWSNTQTLTIPSISSSVTPAPSSNNSQSSNTPTLPPDTISDDSTRILFSIIVVTLVISVISLVMYVRHLKKTNAVKK
jgi:hypothetical protein